MNDAHQLTLALGGRWHATYGMARCPAHPDKTPSLSLSNGSDGRLLMHCHAGCSFEAIRRALKANGITMNNSRRLSVKEAKELEDHRRQSEIVRANQALKIWWGAKAIHGSLAETYLRGRGITCPLPDSLRFHPNCWHRSGYSAPAMIAEVTVPGWFGIHRTWLRPDGSGKADLNPAKAMLGKCAGGAVHLSCGEGPLVVAEGIETALSLASGLLPYPATIWATLGTTGMKSVMLPKTPGELTVATDGDRPGRQAGDALSLRASTSGWKVWKLDPGDDRDWNDVLRERCNG